MGVVNQVFNRRWSQFYDFNEKIFTRQFLCQKFIEINEIFTIIIHMIICCVFLSHSRESSAPYFKLLDILNIENTFKLRISLLAHKISQNVANIPEVFQNYLIKVSDVHSYNTRYASNLNFHVPCVRSNYGKHTFRFAITKTWEEIPTKIKTLSYHKLKKECKQILVNFQS